MSWSVLVIINVIVQILQKDKQTFIKYLILRCELLFYA